MNKFTAQHFRFLVLGMCLIFLGIYKVSAQTDTVFSPAGLTANTVGLSNFTFEVSSTSAINIKRMATAWNTAGNLDVWYRVGGVQHQAGQAPVITTANGWIFIASIPMTSSTTPIMIPYLFNIPVNPGTPVGIYFGGSLRYTGAGQPDVYTDNTVSVSFETGKGYAGGTFPNVGTTPRRIVGYWAYEAAFACTTAVGGTAVPNNSVICVNAPVTVNVTGSSQGSGLTFQWQSSLDSLTWTNMTGEINASLSANPATTTFYRRIITCGTFSDTSLPAKVTTIGTPLPAGTYTINSALPTGSGNYASFTDFVTDITCGGVAGPVVVNVFPAAQGYNEQILFQSIPNTSATNTITINGNGALLTSSAGNAFQRATLSIYGSSHIKIKNLVIQNTHGTIGYAVEMANDSRFIEFDSCEFKIPIVNTALASSCFILSNTNNNPTTAGLAARDLTIKNSLFEGGYYGLVLNGPTAAPWSSNNVIENNIFRDFYLYAFFIRGQENTLIKGNDISRPNRTTLSTFYGFYINSGVEGLVITGNSIHNTADNLPANSSANYPIYATGANATATNPCIFSNNLIYNINNAGLTYGAYILSGTHIYLYHNTICIDNNLTTAAGAQRNVFLSAASGVFEFRNNIFTMTHSGTGAKHCMYVSSTVPTLNINHNQYNIGSTTGTNDVGFYGSTSFNTFAQWQAANNGAFDQAGVYGDPIFLNQVSGDLTPQSALGNAAGANLLSVVPIDFNGVARTITPDIGAIEFTPATCLQPFSITGFGQSGGFTVNWINDPDADSVRIEYGPTGFNQGTGIFINVAGTTFSATGLFPNQCYDIYINSFCNGIIGTSTGLITLCTPCNTATLPYTESFGNWPPPCFTITGTGSWTWQHLAANGYAVAPFWSFSTGASTMKTQNVLISANAWVKFAWAHQYNASYPNDRLILRAKAVNSSNWDTLRNLIGSSFNSPNSGSTTPPPSAADFIEEQIILDPAIYSNQEVEFELIGVTNFGPHVYIDYFTVEQVPQCLPPFNISAPIRTGTSASIAWSTLTGTCFKLEFGPTGFNAGTGQGTVVQNATSPTTITGLTPNTVYDVYIANCCDTTNFAGPFTFNSGCASALSGFFTINKNAPVSATNFQSIQAFINAINNCGLSGPVTAHIVSGSGPYNEQILIDTLVGASATNSVTIVGNGNRMSFASTNTNQRATLTLNGTRHLIIRNLEIQGAGTANVHAVEFRNGASHITLDSCYIFVDKNVTVTTVNPLAWSDSPTSPTTTSITGFNNNTIKNCVIEGGYYGFIANGPNAAPWSSNNVIENNEIRDFYLYGLWLRGQDGTTVKGNSINRKNRTTVSTFYGLYLVGGMENVHIIGNRIHDNSTLAPSSTSSAYPVYATGLSGVATKPILFANNLMYNINSNGLSYGMYILGTSTAWQIYHNSLSLDNTAGASTSAQRVFFSSASSGSFDMRNNIFTCTFGGTGTKNLVYISNTTPTYTINYNQYHAGGGGAATVNHVGYWGTTNFNTLANWKTANNAAFEANGISGNPLFVNPLGDNLTPTNPVGNNVAFNLNAIVPTDYNGVQRSATPDMGAIEFTPAANDITTIGLVVPSPSSCGDSNSTVEVVVRNIGTASQSNFTIGANIIGAITANMQLTYTGTLVSQQIDTILVGTFNSTAGGTFNIEGYVSLANDANTSNDTLATSVTILDVLPRIPTAALDSVCQGGYDTLYFPGNAGNQAFVWLTTTGDTLGTSDSLVVGPMGANDTTFILRPGSAPAQVGPLNNTIGTTGNYTAMNHYLLFTVNTATTIYSVDVFANNAGLVDVVIQDGATQATLHTITVPATGPGLNTLVINQNLQPGTYRMGGTTTNNAGGLQRNSSGAVFPYVATDNSISITGTTFNATSYYFFYNWQLDGSGCPRPDGEITIYNRGLLQAAFTSTPLAPTLTDLTVNFNASSSAGANTYSWDFGDGNTGSGMTTTHSYTANGNYNVQLIITGDCGTDTMVQSITIAGIGLEETLLGQSLSVFPNPNTGNFRVSFMVEGVKKAQLQVLNPMGQVIYSHNPGNISGQYKHDIDLSRMAAGVYILQITTEDGIISRRVTVQK